MLTEFSIPDSVLEIGKQAFEGCSLREVSLPAAFSGSAYWQRRLDEAGISKRARRYRAQ